MSTSKVYHDPFRPSAFPPLENLAAALHKKNKFYFRAWLEQQCFYTLDTHVRKRFLRNPYNVTNVMDVCECDLQGDSIPRNI